jgi:hypothetical protein
MAVIMDDSFAVGAAAVWAIAVFSGSKAAAMTRKPARIPERRELEGMGIGCSYDESDNGLADRMDAHR